MNCQHIVWCVAVSLFSSGTTSAQYRVPNIIHTSDPTSAELNGTTIVNYGLVGVGRIPKFIDAQGSTFGSISAMGIVPGTWSYDALKKEYSGDFLTLPDRGRNDPDQNKFINFQSRIQRLKVTFKPAEEDDGSSQDQIRCTYQGVTLLTEADGRSIVGNDPGTETGEAFGHVMPRKDGNLTLDAEGLTLLANGPYYVSDEYSCAVYRFDVDGVLTGIIPPPDAILPRDKDGVPHFNSTSAPATGRRNNHGLEGLCITPDGKHLIAMTQTAAMQDCSSKHAGRWHARVLVYDISNNDASPKLIGHYVLELPTFCEKGNGGKADRTAGQSELIAVSSTQFLLLARDGLGRGSGNQEPPVFKSILLADLTGATNLLDTSFEGTAPIASEHGLNSDITSITHVEVINMLNMFDLDSFSLNLDTAAQHPDHNAHTLSEKWEGMCLVPDLATDDVTDYFLFVANDNDFQTTEGLMKTSDGQDVHYSDSLEHDTMMLVYRIVITSR